MKRAILSLICCAVALLMGSCASYTQKSVGNKIPINSPKKLEYIQNLKNQTLLGEVEVSVDYRRYLGFIYNVDKVNDQEQEYVKRNHNKVSFTVRNDGYRVGLARKGEFKVLESYPDADYFVISGTTKQTERMFLGSYNRRTVTYKAYKFSEERVEPLELYRKRHIYK